MTSIIMPIPSPSMPTVELIQVGTTTSSSVTLSTITARETENREFILVAYAWRKLSDFSGETHYIGTSSISDGVAPIDFITSSQHTSGTDAYDSVQGVYIGHANVASNDYVNLTFNRSANRGTVYGLFAAYNLTSKTPTSSGSSSSVSGASTFGYSNLVIPARGVRAAIFGTYGGDLQPTLSTSNTTVVDDNNYSTNMSTIMLLDYLNDGDADEDTSVTGSNHYGVGYAYAAWS